MSYSQCLLSERQVIDTVFGETLVGNSITVDWLGANPYLAYFTVLCFLGFWKENIKDMTGLKFAVLLWKCSIFFFALTAVIGGITRFALFLGVAHNGAEMNMIVNLLFIFKPKWKNNKQYRLTVQILGSAYILIEMAFTLALQMTSGYYVLAIMGATCDITITILSIIALIKYVYIAFGSVISYRKIKGVSKWQVCATGFITLTPRLLFNVVAVGFASVPEDQGDFRRIPSSGNIENEDDDRSSYTASYTATDEEEEVTTESMHSDKDEEDENAIRMKEMP